MGRHRGAAVAVADDENSESDGAVWSVLMVAADPSAHARLRLQAEERAIRSALNAQHGDATARGTGVDFDVLPAATLDDLAQQLLRKTYDVIHFSGHCSVHAHMVELIYVELGRQHGADAPQRARANHAAARAVAELAEQVVIHLESQSAHLLDAVSAFRECHEDDPNPAASPSAGVRRRSRSCEPRGPSPTAVRSSDSRCNSVDPPRSSSSRPSSDATLANAAALQRVPRAPVFVPHVSTADARPRSPPAVKNPAAAGNDDDAAPLVLRIPDGGGGTRDVVLTKRQILDAGVGSLAFESHTPRAPIHFVTARAFAALLAPYAGSLRCVLLNACHAQLLCEQLLAHGVPLAVCASGRLSDTSAMHFSRGFYEAVAAGGSVERAFKEGRHRMAAHARAPAATHTSEALVPATHESSRDTTDSVALLRARGGVRLAGAAVEELRRARADVRRLREVIRRGAKMLERRDAEVCALRAQLARATGVRVSAVSSEVSSGEAERKRTTVRVRLKHQKRPAKEQTSTRQSQSPQHARHPAFGSAAPRFPRSQAPDITRYERT